MRFGSTPPINDSDLADVKEFACTGRAVPAVIVSAIIARLEQAERGKAPHAPILVCHAGQPVTSR